LEAALADGISWDMGEVVAIEEAEVIVCPYIFWM
jgi:hypothetical protein